MKVKEIVMEVLFSILPIALLIVLIQVTVAKVPTEVFVRFIGGAVMVMLGLALFLLGAKIGFLPAGEWIGSTLAQKGKLWLILLLGLVIGFVTTIAEPDVHVLSLQVDSVSGNVVGKNMFVISIALGVGVFSAMALLRMFFNIPIAHILCGCFVLASILAFFAPPEFFAISFDAGGATTGPITVPFVLALGVGIASVTGKKGESNDSFGLLGLASVGPIIVVLLLGVLYR